MGDDFILEDDDFEMDDGGEDWCVDPFEEDLMDCHLDYNGNCGMAGSEWCDFECPNRHVKRN